VTSVVSEGDGVTSVYMKGSTLDDLGAQPGQFFVWRFLGRSGWTRGNPYSLSAAPDGRSLRISVKDLGDNSARTAHLAAGTRVMLEGPYGRLSPRARTRDKVALIGAGVGVAPLRSLAEGLEYTPEGATLLYRFSADPLFDREFEVLARERGLRVVYLPGSRRADDSWLSHRAGVLNDAEALRALVPDVAERDVFVCGPDIWAQSVRRAAVACGVLQSQIHIESFGW
jgi:ferredoxin-NADP reductase